jgi:hypothetical protein
MNLKTVRDTANLVGKTPSMIFFLVGKRNLFTKYPIEGSADSKSPGYLIDSDEVVEYYKNKEPRKNYSTFLDSALATIDNDGYVSAKTASNLLGISDNRVRYLSKKYSIKKTIVRSPKRGRADHSLINLSELKKILDVESKIIELRDSISTVK